MSAISFLPEIESAQESASPFHSPRMSELNTRLRPSRAMHSRRTLQIGARNRQSAMPGFAKNNRSTQYFGPFLTMIALASLPLYNIWKNVFEPGFDPPSSVSERIAGMTWFGKLILATGLSLAPAVAIGDAIWVGESSQNPIMAGDVHIISIQSNTLVYSIGDGEQATKPLDQVQQMSVGGETDFNIAE